MYLVERLMLLCVCVRVFSKCTSLEALLYIACMKFSTALYLQSCDPTRVEVHLEHINYIR